MEHLQKQLENIGRNELAQKMHSSQKELDSIYAEYTDALSYIGLIVEKYYKTFRNSHEEYVQIFRVKQKAIVLERKKNKEPA